MRRRRSIVLAVLVVLIPLAFVHAEGAGLADASKLRDASAEDWKAGRHAEAAEKLKRALEIYDQIDGEKPVDRAITLRALVWNLYKAGAPDEATAAYFRLLDLDPSDAGVKVELWSAYSPLCKIAASKENADAVRAFWAPVRARFRKLELPGMAAQVLHDIGSVLADKSDLEGAAEAYAQAIEEREKIEDDLGLTWSLNNLANAQLRFGKLEDALDPLLGAYRRVHERRVAAPQAAVAENIRTVLAKLDEAEAPTKPQEAWLWKIAELGAAAHGPEVLPSDDLLRRAVQLSRTRGGNRAALKALKRLRKAKLEAQPPETIANLALFAGTLAIECAKPSDARRWLADVDVGEGPLAPHLTARLHTARARAAAGRKKAASFVREAEAAVNAWKPLEDRGGREASLGALAEAAAAIEAPNAATLQKAYKELRSTGKPGGLGSQALGSANIAAFGSLPTTGPLFEIWMEEDGIHVQDLVAERGTTLELRWQPAAVSLNGLSLVFFGAWVRIDGLAYGGASSTSGQSGTSTVEAMGAVRPIPERGKLVVLKNGAVLYGEVTR